MTCFNAEARLIELSMSASIHRAVVLGEWSPVFSFVEAFRNIWCFRHRQFGCPERSVFSRKGLNGFRCFKIAKDLMLNDITRLYTHFHDLTVSQLKNTFHRKAGIDSAF